MTTSRCSTDLLFCNGIRQCIAYLASYRILLVIGKATHVFHLHPSILEPLRQLRWLHSFHAQVSPLLLELSTALWQILKQKLGRKGEPAPHIQSDVMPRRAVNNRGPFLLPHQCILQTGPETKKDSANEDKNTWIHIYLLYHMKNVPQIDVKTYGPDVLGRRMKPNLWHLAGFLSLCGAGSWIFTDTNCNGQILNQTSLKSLSLRGSNTH